jgi:hypothetical protein
MTDQHFDDTTITDAFTELHSEVGALSLDAAVTELANARAEEVLLKALCDAALADWKRDNAMLLTDMEKAREAVTEAERTVRTATLEAYIASGSKKPHPAVQVRLTKVVTYDEDKASVWGMVNAPLLMRLDTNAFKKLVLANVVPVDIAQVDEVPQATIATDLSAWLESEGE